MVTSSVEEDPLIEVGKAVGLHGLAGWIKVISYTDPVDALKQYRPLTIAGRVFDKPQIKSHGKGLMVRFDVDHDRTAAQELIGHVIRIRRSQLPGLPEGEYYHADLEGMQVIGDGEEALGTVQRVMNTGANDVLVCRLGGKDILVPWIMGQVVHEVDEENAVIRVHWGSDWL